MRTTIDLPDAMLRRAKAKAALEGSSLKEIFYRALKRELAVTPAVPREHRVKLPLIKGTPGQVVRSLSREKIDELMFG